MKKTLLSLVIAFSVVSAQAAVFQYSLTLNGASESPPNASPGTASGTVNYDDLARTLQVQVSFGGLQGNTTAAHIHSPTPAPFSGTASPSTQNFVGFPLGVSSSSFSNTLDLTLASSWSGAYITANGGTTAGAEAALASDMAQNRAYFNIHSSAFPGGEIRGFTVAVPEPSTLALLGLGAFGMAFRFLKKKRHAINS